VATVGNLLVLISGSNAPLTAALAKSEAELKAFSGTATGHGATASTGLHTVGLAALGVVGAVGVMGAASVKAAADFQEQMGIINTIAKQSPDDLDKTGQAIRALSVSSGTGLTDLTKGFYDLLSAGVPVTQAMDTLRQANTLAIGGLATTAQTVDLITTAINSYSLTTRQSAVATDQFALAVQDGKVTADQIAASFADVAPLAHQMGIGIDEISTTYAVLTAKGVPASETMTQMNRAMLELMKPSADLAALQKKTGLNFQEIAGDKGLVVALQEMREAAAANGMEFGQNLLPRIEGLKFALATTGPNFQTYADELVKMHHATGTAADQAAERMQTFDRQLSILGNSLQSLAIGVGNAFLPALTGIVQQVSGVVQAISDWSNANPGLAGTILAVVGGVAALVAGIVFVGPIIGAVAGAIAVLLSPIGLVIAAIAGLAIAWQNNWGGIQEVVGSVVAAIAPIIGTLGDLVSTVGFAIANGLNAGSVAAEAFREGPFGQLGSFVSDVVGGLADLVGTVGSAIANGLNPGSVAAEAFREGPFGQLGGFVSDTVATIAGAIRTGFDALSGIGSQLNSALSGIGGLSGIGDQITAGLGTAFAALPGLIGPGIEAAKAAFGGLADAASAVGSAIGSFLGDAGNQQTILNGISTAAAATRSVLGSLGDIIGHVGSEIGKFVSDAGNQRAALDALRTAAQVAGTVLSTLGGIISTVVGAIVNFSTNANNQAAALRIVGVAGDVVRGVLGALATAVSVVIGWFSNFASHLVGTSNTGKATGDVLRTLGSVLSTVATIIGTVIGVVATVIIRVTDAANRFGVFKAAGDLVYTLFGLLGTALGTLFTQFGSLASIVGGALSTAFSAIKVVIDGITAAVNAATAAIGGLIAGAKQAVDAVASIPGVKLGSDVVGNVGGAIGGAIPHFAQGGVVPGTGPQLAVVHGGETVTPPGQSSGGQGMVEVHSHLHLDGREISEVVERHLFRNASTYSSGFLSNSGIVGA
jgi:TP901 family phage tail tape measure protein